MNSERPKKTMQIHVQDAFAEDSNGLVRPLSCVLVFLPHLV
jgi:hypothetical protein